MRDKRFITIHRGGQLTKEQHIQLMNWSCACVEHIMHYFDENADERILNAIKTGKKWSVGSASVGDARKASVKCLELARELSDPVSIAVTRASGHAVATAHMADHSLGGSLYALRAVSLAGGSIESEKKWQDEQLTSDIRQLAISGRSMKEIHFKFTLNKKSKNKKLPDETE